MKSPTTSATKGFLLIEAVVAFGLLTILLSSIVVLKASMGELQKIAVKKLERLEWVHQNSASSTLYEHISYGNDSTTHLLEPITKVQSDYGNGWGRDTCNPRLLARQENITAISVPDSGNHGTDLEVRNGIAYATADSPLSSLPDLYIIDLKNNLVIASLNTGPGLSALEVAGPHVYAANLGTTNELQIIDIHDRTSPIVLSKLKLPLPEASTTPPFATSIFYRKGIIYLGTEKWDGKEFSIIDVHIPTSPQYMGGYETGTQINDIYVRDGTAHLAASDKGQMRTLSIQDPQNIVQLSQFSPTGWETQEGKKLSYFEGELSLGRTTGGFNVVLNHELFLFSTSTGQISRDIPGGVYGITDNHDVVLIATHAPGHELQAWNKQLDRVLFEKSLSTAPRAMACDGELIYLL